MLELLEKAGLTSHSKQSKPSRRLVYAKEACQIIGKSLSSLYRGIKAPNDPIPSYKRGKLLYFYEDEENFTRYNNSSEEQFWLSAFNGSTTMSDRKNSQNSIFIKRPFISVVGTIQKRLLTELANGERTANGLAQSSFALLRGH